MNTEYIELTVIPTKSEIFLGSESEWKEKIQNSKYSLCEVAILKNNGDFKRDKLFWCDDKSSLYIPLEKRNSFNIEDFSKHYEFTISEAIEPLTKSEKEAIARIEREKLEIMKKKEVLAALREADIKNAPLITSKEFFKKRNHRRVSALRIEKGAKFQKQLLKINECSIYNHILIRAIAILTDKKGIDQRIGDIYVCSTCGKMYLTEETLDSIIFNNFPNYSFVDCKIIGPTLADDSKTPRPNQGKETEQISKEDISQYIKEAGKHYPPFPKKNNDLVVPLENAKIIVGQRVLKIISSDRNMIPCQLGLFSIKSKHFVFHYGAAYCPDNKEYYLNNSQDIGSLEKNYPVYSFQAFHDAGAKKEINANNKDRSNDARASLQAKESENLTYKNAVYINGEGFLVRSNSILCRKNGHKCKEITACVTVLQKAKQIRDIFVTGWYCQNCKCYYISEKDFEFINGIGTILAKVYTETEWKNSKVQGYMELNEESILHKLGYNVGMTDNLSDSTRHNILAVAVDFKILSKSQIMEFLSFMINMRSGNPVMQNAVYKWKKDYRFISSYKLDSTHFVRVKALNLKETLYKSDFYK